MEKRTNFFYNQFEGELDYEDKSKVRMNFITHGDGVALRYKILEGDIPEDLREGIVEHTALNLEIVQDLIRETPQIPFLGLQSILAAMPYDMEYKIVAESTDPNQEEKSYIITSSDKGIYFVLRDGGAYATIETYSSFDPWELNYDVKVDAVDAFKTLSENPFGVALFVRSYENGEVSPQRKQIVIEDAQPKVSNNMIILHREDPDTYLKIDAERNFLADLIIGNKEFRVVGLTPLDAFEEEE